MKKISFLCLSSMLGISALGQINSTHNAIRIGDQLVKQQVEYKDPGKPGKGVVWDFSDLKTINDEYTLSYSSAPLLGDSVYIMGNTTFDKKIVKGYELIVGTEHNTMYYYRLSDDSLVMLGHENPAIRLEYPQPIMAATYPLNYGQKALSSYTAQGLYSGVVDVNTRGSIELEADAFGKLVLPNGDTLNPVLRIKNIQTITELESDSLIASNKQVETYRWYTKGYRYPIFETIRSIDLQDNAELFTTAFYFPLQDHLYLDTDPENLALIEENWNVDRRKGDAESDVVTKEVSVADIMDCKIYPNPVESQLTLEYELKEDARVWFDIYSMDGNIVKRVKTLDRKMGTYVETIDCSGLYPRNYVLRVNVNQVFENVKIIKK